MSGISYRLRAELRGSWRGALGVALLIGLLGGIVLASAAGARRTASAYPRMLEHSGFPSLIVSPPGGPGLDPTPFYDQVAALPEVEALGLVAGFPAFPLAGSPTAEMERRLAAEGGNLRVFLASVDGAVGRTLGRPLVTAGRLPDPTRPDEAFASGAMVRRSGVQLGDRLDLVLVPGEEYLLAAEPTDGVPLSVTVVGLGIFPEQVIPFSDLDAGGTVLFTPAAAELLPRSAWDFEGIMVDLEPSAAPDEVAATIEELGAASEHTGGPVFIQDQSQSAARVQDGLRPLAVAVALFATVLAVVGAAIAGQTLLRHTHRSSAETEALTALGLTARQQGLVTMARATLIGSAGAILAVVVALAASPRFPIGPARLAEPDPGVRADAAVLGLGGAGIVLVMAAAAVPPLLLHRRSRRRDLTVAARLSRAGATVGLPAPAVQGVRFALDPGDQPGSTPSRSTLVAGTTAVAFVLAAAVFSTSLSSLIDTPSRYGQGWDRLLDNQFSPVPAGLLVEDLGDDPAVAGITAGSYLDVRVAGESTAAVTMLPITGSTGLTAVRGRPATAPGEVALGGELLDRLDLDLGDVVALDTGDGSRPAEVVGEVVFPRFNQGTFGQTGLGRGAQIHPDDAPSLFTFDMDEGPLPEGFELDGRLHNFLAVDLDPAASERAVAALDEQLERYVDDQVVLDVRDRQPPTTISDLARVRSLPLTLAAVLVVAAVGVLGHLLLSAVRSRRRELALLASIGFTSRQLRSAVRWQATLVAALAVLVGAPLGLALGRQAWAMFTRSIHVGDVATTPWWWIALTVPAALLIANLAAALPARRVRRIPPALVLREE